MQRTRDWRRAQFARIVHRVYCNARNNEWYTPEPLTDWMKWYDDKDNVRYLRSWDDIFELRKRRAKRLANNRCTCSSYCCGNQRRWSGEVTRQEKRFTCDEVD
jgi:hypothetical protein